MLSILEHHSQEYEVTHSLLKILGVKVSPGTLKKDIEEHPYYPSLLCISDVLSKYGIENITASFTTDKVPDIPPPYITRIRSRQGNKELLVTVQKKVGDVFHFHDPEKHKVIASHEPDFLKDSTGIILMADPAAHAGERDYDKQMKIWRKERMAKYAIFMLIPLVILLSGLNTVFTIGQGAVLPFTYTVLTFSGCIISFLLLIFEADQHNPLLKQICGTGEKVNCGAILNSRAAKIGGVSWSVIGFTYFAGGFLLSLLQPQALSISAWLNMLAIPYVPFSIYYQWRIAKQWCPLCLSVQMVLVLQFLTTLAGNFHIPSSMTTQTITVSLVAYLIPAVGVTLLLPAIRGKKEAGSLKRYLHRLKQDPDIFQGLLSRQKAVTENVEGLGITLGNPDATYQIVKVCSPYCHPCSIAHPVIEDILHNNPDVQVRIIFKVPADNDDLKLQPVKHLMAIAADNNINLTKQALDDWYLAEKKDYQAFALKYPLPEKLDSQNGAIDAMRNWCTNTGTRYTPTIFLSISSEEKGVFRELPEMYSVNDLKYFLSV